MSPFVFERVSKVEQAVEILREEPDAKLLAGGQSLLASMRLGLSAPTTLIDLQDLAELKSIVCDGSWLTVGAMATHAQIASSGVVKNFCPMLSALAHGIGDKQIRNRGTLGGAISNNDPAACWPAGLVALGAIIVTDRREIAADEFFLGLFQTALAFDEIVCAVKFNQPRYASYIKFEQPASRFALVGVAVSQSVGVNPEVRVALTGLGMGVARFTQAEACLSRSFRAQAMIGCRLEQGVAMGDVHASAEYRAHLASVLTSRAVTKALIA
jgi:aerobic carbon-monoxide dehydrogenase medium subunit